MEQDHTSKGNRGLIFLIIFLGIFVGGLIGFRATPIGINKTYNQFVVTEDNVKICYNIFEPANDPSTNKNAIIMGHGVMVNKEVMKMMALELAYNGFVVVTIDFRGHGRSMGDFNFAADGFDLDSMSLGDMGNIIRSFFNYSILAQDVLAIKNMLALRGDINMSNLGYIGYSMGGGVGIYLTNLDSDFNAMIGLCPVPLYDSVNVATPRNLLLLASKYDEGIPVEDLVLTIENKTKVSREYISSNITQYSVWEFEEGNFEDGTAARIFYNKYQEHFLAAWDVNYIKEARNWMIRALKGQTPSNPNQLEIYPFLSASLIIGFIGAIGLFVVVLGILVPKFAKDPKKIKDRFPIKDFSEATKDMTIKQVCIKALPHVLLLSFPCMLFFLPFFLGHLLITGFQLMLMFGPSVAVLLFLRRLLKKKNIRIKNTYIDIIKSSNWSNILIAIVLGVVGVVLIQNSIGQVFSVIPAANDWPWIPLYFFITAFIYTNFILFFQPIIQEKIQAKEPNKTKSVIKATLINLQVNILLSAFILLTPSILMGFYFIVMFFVPVCALHVISSITATYLYSKNKDIVLIGLVSAFIPCMMFSTLSPLIWIGNFI